MRILFVTCYYAPAHVYGGPTRSIPALCTALVRLGCDVAVYTTNANGRENLEIESNVLHDVNGVAVRYFEREWKSNYFYSSRLAKACRQTIGQFDLVYIVSNWGFPLIPACRSARRAGVPYVISPRTGFMQATWNGKYFKKSLYHWLFERNQINHAKAIHYTSDLERTESHWLGLQPRAFVASNPVSLDEFEHLPARGKFRIANDLAADDQVVLFLGRVEARKGLDFTLESFARVASANPRARLVLAGPEEDGYIHFLKDRSKALGIVDRVLFSGLLGPQQRLEALVDADAFILTSYSENFGMSVVEAMAACLPVIVSDRVGLAEDIRRHQAGIVVPLNTAEIAQGLETILSQASLRAQFGASANRLAHEKYSPPQVAKLMLDEFQYLGSTDQIN